MYRLLCLFGALISPSVTLADPPVNDECENAIAITGEGIFPFDSTGATASDPPVTDCERTYGLSNGLDADIWFAWTPERSTYYTIDTCGQTTLDTRIAVSWYEYCPPDPGGDCNDDGCLFQSRLTVGAGPFGSTLIRIGTYPGGNGGTGTFRITLARDYPDTDPSPDPNELGCPSPAQPSPGEALETCNARDHWDAHNSTRTQFVVADEFVPEEDGELTGVCWWGTYLRDGEECPRDLVDFFEITYYADDCGGPGEVIAGPFSQEDVTMEVIGPFETYESFPNGAFEYQYTARHDPIEVRVGEVYWISITNSYYNRCSWYWETALGNSGHAVQFDEASDTSASVRSDMAFCFRLVETDGPPCFPPPPNDDCADALPLGEETVSFDTSGATTDGPENVLHIQHPRTCYFGLSDEQVHKDVWYDVTVPCTSSLRLDACDSSFDTKLAVYEGAACPSTSPAAACNDDACGGELARQSQLFVDVQEGGEYKLRVGGFNDDWGTGRLTLSFGPRSRTSLSDFALFANCFMGTNCLPLDFAELCCTFQDFDADGQVDAADYPLFRASLAGP
jgi:hypothetical protein